MESSLSLSLATLTPASGLRATITKLQFKPYSNSHSFTQNLTALRRLKLFNTKTNVSSNDPTTVDYSSMTSSVFPAEACETVGGEACNVDAIYPEAKLTPSTDNAANKNATTDSESVEREYLQYDGPKTVFLDEACDDLGGEFCEPDFQPKVN